MKLDSELKLRLTCATKKRLRAEAEAACKDVSEHVRELLATRQNQAREVDLIERIERLMVAVAPLLRPRDDSAQELMIARLARLEIVMEETAMAQSPQILSRVNQRLKALPPAKTGGVQ